MNAVPKDDLFQNNLSSDDMLRFQRQSFVRSVSAKPGRISNVFGTCVLLALITACISGGFYLSKPQTLPIKQVRIVGEFRHLSPSRLQTLVTDSVRGGFFNVNVVVVRNELLKAPWVEDVEVNRIWPDTLRVQVKERIAVARWGENALLNSDAKHFMPPLATIPYDLPLLNGPDGSYELVLNKFEELNQVLARVGLHVVELELNERRAWSFKVQRGFKVVVGRRDYQNRVKRFVDVVIHAMANRIDEIKEVDMRYTNGFAVRWKEGDSV